ncbi:MAG: four helix bundle protein [Planctomycetes bacterium]|nr:four helix bundle protein [Planctomycetota bacterium]
MAATGRRGYQPAKDADGTIVDPLANYPAYVKAMEFYDRVADDTDLMMRDPRARVIAVQMIESAGSISANFEEGYGRTTTPEFIHRLRIANGEARETRGWYHRARKFLPAPLVEQRLKEADEVIALLVSTIKGLEARRSR